MHRQFTCLLLTERSKGKMGRLGVRARVVNGKANEIRTHFFHNCFKLCSDYKHSNLLVSRLTYWTIQV